MYKFADLFVSLQRKSQSNMVKVVIHSILYLFGFGSNPLPKRARRVKHQSDYDAISSDWYNVGMDIRNAMSSYEQQEKRN